MKKIIATEEIFSPITNAKPIAIRYHYADGSHADAPIKTKSKIEDLPQTLQDTIRAFEAKRKKIV